jgi:hypothetical protein
MRPIIIIAVLFLLFEVTAVLLGGLMAWPLQLAAFGLAALAALFLWPWLSAKFMKPPAQPLPGGISTMPGQSFTLDEPILAGRGVLRSHGREWTLLGPDLAAGTLVRVIDVQDSRLLVERVENPEGGPNFPKAGTFGGV